MRIPRGARLISLLAVWALGSACDRNETTRDQAIATSSPAQPTSTTGERPFERPACPPASGCEILGRYEVGSATAIERGFGQLTMKDGAVSCDPEALNCYWDNAPQTATIVETSDTCGLWGDFLLLAGSHVYVQRPQSIGDQGGPGFALVAVEGADAGSYEPLARGFGRDASQVYDHGEWLVGADVRTFEVLDCPDMQLACDATRCW